MLKKSDLLRRAYENEEEQPCFCVGEDGVILWANKAVLAYLPCLIEGVSIDLALPECFPNGFSPVLIGESRTIYFPQGDETLTFTRFHVQRSADFFLVRYDPSGQYQVTRGDSGRDSVPLMTSFLRQRVNRIFDLTSSSHGEMEDLAYDYEQESPFLSKRIYALVERLASAEEDCRSILCMALQMEEYYRFATRTDLVQKQLDMYSYFSQLLHQFKVCSLQLPLDFDYEIENSYESWTLVLDEQRYTIALLGMFRVSCLAALQRGHGKLRVWVREENGEVCVDIEEAEQPLHALMEERVQLLHGGQQVPTPGRMAYENLRKLTEFHGGSCVLAAIGETSGWRIQLRLPAELDLGGRLFCDPGYTPGIQPNTLGGQLGLVKIMLAGLGDFFYG